MRESLPLRSTDAIARQSRVMGLQDIPAPGRATATSRVGPGDHPTRSHRPGLHEATFDNDAKQEGALRSAPLALGPEGTPTVDRHSTPPTPVRQQEWGESPSLTLPPPPGRTPAGLRRHALHLLQRAILANSGCQNPPRGRQWKCEG